VKEVVLLRHAKSAWPKDGRPDRDRPLSARGKQDAGRIGRVIQDHALVPDLVLSSPAKRALATAKRIVKAWSAAVPVQVDPALYEGGALGCLQVLADLPDSIDRVLAVGHSPTFEDLVALMTGRHETLKTATAAVVRLPIEVWSELAQPTRGELRAVLGRRGPSVGTVSRRGRARPSDEATDTPSIE